VKSVPSRKPSAKALHAGAGASVKEAADAPLAGVVDKLFAAVGDLPAQKRRHKGAAVEVRSGVVSIAPALAKAILSHKGALTRAIDMKHAGGLREQMVGGHWVEDSSVIQIHAATKPSPHLFVVDGAHRLAAISGHLGPLRTMVVVRRFESANTDADVASYDAANSQKAQSLQARAKTIARRAAPDGWTQAEANDKASIRGSVRYGTLVQQGYRFGARAPARNLPMTKVMDAAFDIFPAVRKLVADIGAPQTPVARLLTSDAILALLALAARAGFDVDGFVQAALTGGPIQRELAKIAAQKNGGGSGAIIDVQAVAAALLWKSGRAEGEALRAIYQDRETMFGDVKVRF
jgi:hypothetical protein